MLIRAFVILSLLIQFKKKHLPSKSKVPVDYFCPLSDTKNVKQIYSLCKYAQNSYTNFERRYNCVYNTTYTHNAIKEAFVPHIVLLRYCHPNIDE